MMAGKHEILIKMRHFLKQNLACSWVINLRVWNNSLIEREFWGGREEFCSFKRRVWGERERESVQEEEMSKGRPEHI